MIAPIIEPTLPDECSLDRRQRQDPVDYRKPLNVLRVHVATPDELTAGRCCLECLRSSLGDREPDTGLMCQLHGKYTRNNFCCDAFEPPFYFYTTPHL